MTISPGFLAALTIAANKCPGPRTLQWPAPKQPGGFITFADFAEWQRVILDLSLSTGVPLNMVDLFDRALKLHLIAWLDFDLITSAELAAFAALEHSLRDCYQEHFRKQYMKKAIARVKKENRELRLTENFRPSDISLSSLLKHMHQQDGLTDDRLGCVRKYGGTVMRLLTDEPNPGLAGMRNSERMEVHSVADTNPACLSSCVISSNTPIEIASARRNAAH